MRWQRSFSIGGKARRRRSSTRREKPRREDVPEDLAWRAPLGERYEVKQLIGAGSYSHVVEARDSITGQLVAIKRIGRVFEDLIDCKRILREIAILKRLDHDNVVQLRDICLPHDLAHFDEVSLVLEMCHSDLKQLFRTPVTLSMAVVKTLLYNTLVGVKYVHSAGIYHRDLKPANCLVNEDCSVKICDFGLARAAPQQKVLRRQLTGHVVTRWYRAPELILLQHYTEAVDVWSLGCIAAELFAMLKDNHQNPAKRKPLFRGSSCFPLSPDHECSPGTERENRDQLNIILSILGTPSGAVIDMLKGEEVKNYLRFFPEHIATPFAALLPGLDDDGVNLIKQLLSFCPTQRLSVTAAVAHPFLQSVRREDKEKVYEHGPMILPFECDTDLDESKLRRYALREIKRFHPDLDISDDDSGG